MKRVGVIGSGTVGETLANGFLKHGYEVMRGSRDPGKLSDWKQGAGAHAKAGTFKEAAAFGELVVFAVKGTAAEDALSLCGAENLSGKVVLDTTNPIADAAPIGGVLTSFADPNLSLMEKLQKQAPAAKFVKAFSSVGAARMVNPEFKSGVPTMFICGNDKGAKNTAREVLSSFGWETADMGEAQSARAIEPLSMLWCILGFRENSWTHAFKLLKT
jgi:predicted dinucleotide-binding enzyme